MDDIPKLNKQEPFRVDVKPFFDAQEQSLINKIVRSQDLDQENSESKPIEKLKKSLEKQLKEMIDFLSTTEEDQATARAYCTELYREIFDQIKNANSVNDIAEALKKVRHEDITARFYETVRGNWKTLGTLKRRGVKDIEDPLQIPSIDRIFTEVISNIEAFQIMKKALTK